MIITKLLILAGIFMSQVTSPNFDTKPVLEENTSAISSDSDAFIVDNNYQRDDVFVADILISPENGYNVDPTGTNSSTLAIQKAVDDCAALGGGTVYLPAGKYLVTARIDIKPYVNFRGDYKDPDQVENGDYGTIIVAGVPSSSEDVGERINLFRMQGSTALIGITFFYPLQYMESVMPYAYAIEIPGGLTPNMHNVFTIKDITFINAYKGICASITPSGALRSITHEQLHLDNIKGTILREGMHLTNSSEVGGFRDIYLNSSYWANAGEEFNAPDARNIDDFLKKNAVGLILGDLEWHEVQNVKIDNYQTGIYFHDGTRATLYSMSFIGSFYNLQITGAEYGIYVEQLYENMGIEFSKSIIEGSKYALINNSPESDGHLKLSGVTLNGAVGGVNIYWDGNLFDEIPAIDTREGKYVLPKLDLYNTSDYGVDKTGREDTSPAIQQALNDARDNGGGVVYLPAGIYRLEQPLTVYQNTQLRGCGNAVQKDLTNNSQGTLILAYYGADQSTSDTSTSLITLSGENSGIAGLRIIYPDLDLSKQLYNKNTLPKYSYTIRGLNDGVYAENLYLTGSYNGIDFSNNCNNYVIKRVLGVFYNIGFACGGNNGTLDTLLSNGIALTRVSPVVSGWSFADGQLATHIYDLTRQSTTLVKLINANNIMVANVFTFASNTFIDSTNSSFYGFNVGQDSQPANAGKMFALVNSHGVIYNSLRDACSTVATYVQKDETSTFTVYNRITLLPGNVSKSEGNIIENSDFSMGLLGGNSETIAKIWEQEIDYQFVNYPVEDDPLPPPEPEPEPEPDTPKDNTLRNIIIGTSIAVAVVLIAAIIIIIIKKQGR